MIYHVIFYLEIVMYSVHCTPKQDTKSVAFGHNMIISHLSGNPPNLFTVIEESPNGTEIHGVAEYLRQNTLLQLQQGSSQSTDYKAQFQLLDSYDPLTRRLYMNPDDGRLIVRGRIDRESLCPDKNYQNLPIYEMASEYRSEDCVKTLEVLSTFHIDQVQPEVKNVIIMLRIEDINDNSPEWPQLNNGPVNTLQPLPMIELKVLEAAKNVDSTMGQSVHINLPLARDYDSGVNGRVHYRIEAMATDPSKMDPTRSSVSTLESLPFKLDDANGRLDLVATAKLDYEKQAVHQFHLLAFDSGHPAKTSTALIHIHLIDVNDENPVFEHQVYYPPTGAISEKTVPGTILLNLSATDADGSAANNRLRYVMVSPNPLAARYFTVHSDGRVTLRQWLDYESMDGNTPVQMAPNTPIDLLGRKQFTFHVQAIDSAPIPYERKGDALVVIPIKDENDESPVITVRFLGGDPHQTGSGFMGAVIENTVTPIRLAYIQVRDPDFDGNDAVSCHLSDNTNFSLAPVRAVSSDEYISEPSSRNDYMLNLLTTPNREQTPLLYVRIQCTDTVANMNEQAIRIRVLDENDEKPRFTRSVYRFQLSENIIPDRTTNLGNTSDMLYGHIVGRVTAHDKDSGENAQIRYRLASDTLEIVPAAALPYPNDLSDFGKRGDRMSFFYDTEAMEQPTASQLFHIDQTTGVLYSLKSFDAENVALIRFIILAEDQPRGTPAPMSLTGKAAVEVRIVDRNDWTPLFYNASTVEQAGNDNMDETIAPEQVNFVDQYVFHIKENFPPYKLVGRVAALDPDASHRSRDGKTSQKILLSTITLKISSDSDTDVRKKFSLHATSGYIRTLAPLDREQKAVYVFRVIATDEAGLSGTGSSRSATATVTISVTDENDNSPIFIRPVSTRDRISAEQAGSRISDQSSDFSRGTDGLLDRKAVEKAQTSVLNEVITKETITIPMVIVHRRTWMQHSERDGVTTKGRPLLQLEATDADTGDNGKVVYHIGQGNSDNLFILDNSTGILLLSPFADLSRIASTTAQHKNGITSDMSSLLNYSMRFEACDCGKPKRCAIPIWVRIIVDMDDLPDLVRLGQLRKGPNIGKGPGHPPVDASVNGNIVNPQKMNDLTWNSNPLDRRGSLTARPGNAAGSPYYTGGRKYPVGTYSNSHQYDSSQHAPRQRGDYSWVETENGIISDAAVHPYYHQSDRQRRLFDNQGIQRPSNQPGVVVSEAVIVCLIVIFAVLLCAAAILCCLLRKKTILYALAKRRKSKSKSNSDTKLPDLSEYPSPTTQEPLELTESASIYRFNHTNIGIPQGQSMKQLSNQPDSTTWISNDGLLMDSRSFQTLIRRNSEPLLDQSTSQSKMPQFSESVRASQALYSPRHMPTRKTLHLQNPVSNTLPVTSEHLFHPIHPRPMTPNWNTQHSGCFNADVTNSSFHNPYGSLRPMAKWEEPDYQISSPVMYQVTPNANHGIQDGVQIRDLSYQKSPRRTGFQKHRTISPLCSPVMHMRGESLPVYVDHLSPATVSSSKLSRLVTASPARTQTYSEFDSINATLRRHNWCSPINSNDGRFPVETCPGDPRFGPVSQNLFLNPSQYIYPSSPRMVGRHRLNNEAHDRNCMGIQEDTRILNFQLPPSSPFGKFSRYPEPLEEAPEMEPTVHLDNDTLLSNLIDSDSHPLQLSQTNDPHISLSTSSLPLLLDEEMGNGEENRTNSMISDTRKKQGHTTNGINRLGAKYVQDAYREASFV